MEVSIDVPDSLPTDLRLLATAVLKGDESAAIPLADCVMENMTGGPRVCPKYVEWLEDFLRELRRVLRDKTVTPFVKGGTGEGWNTATLDDGDLTVFHLRYFNLERTARQLGRFGLS